MTRDERKDELMAMLLYQTGRERALDVFLEAYSFGAGGVLPSHETPTELVEAILAKEFPVE